MLRRGVNASPGDAVPQSMKANGLSTLALRSGGADDH